MENSYILVYIVSIEAAEIELQSNPHVNNIDEEEEKDEEENKKYGNRESNASEMLLLPFMVLNIECFDVRVVKVDNLFVFFGSFNSS